MPLVPTDQPGVYAAEPPCRMRGPWEPNGRVVATIGCEYTRDDGVNLEEWIKMTDDGLNTGWVLFVKTT